MSSRALAALIKPTVQVGPPVVTRVRRGSGSGSNPTIGMSLATGTGPRLLLCGLYNEEGSGSAYASGLSISGGASLTEITAGRFFAAQGASDHRGQLYWVQSDASGSTDFDVTLSNSDTTQLVVAEITGYDTNDPLGVPISEAQNSSAGLSDALMTTRADSLIVVFAAGERHPVTPGASITTELHDEIQSHDAVFLGHVSAPTVASYPIAIDFDDDSANDGGGLWAVEVKSA